MRHFVYETTTYCVCLPVHILIKITIRSILFGDIKTTHPACTFVCISSMLINVMLTSSHEHVAAPDVFQGCFACRVIIDIYSSNKSDGVCSVSSKTVWMFMNEEPLIHRVNDTRSFL